MAEREARDALASSSAGGATNPPNATNATNKGGITSNVPFAGVQETNTDKATPAEALKQKEQVQQKKKRRRESREMKRQSKVWQLVQTEASKSLLERLLESNSLLESGQIHGHAGGQGDTGRPTGQVMHTLREVSILEEKAAKSYVQHRAHELDVTVVAGYAPCARGELSGVWPKIEKLDGRYVVPGHFTRLLTILAQEKEHLHQNLKGISISHPRAGE